MAGRSVSNEDDAPGSTDVDWMAWQRLLQLEMELATYIRKLTDPSAEWTE